MLVVVWDGCVRFTHKLVICFFIHFQIFFLHTHTPDLYIFPIWFSTPQIYSFFLSDSLCVWLDLISEFCLVGEIYIGFHIFYWCGDEWFYLKSLCGSCNCLFSISVYFYYFLNFIDYILIIADLLCVYCFLRFSLLVEISMIISSLDWKILTVF